MDKETIKFDVLEDASERIGNINLNLETIKNNISQIENVFSSNGLNIGSASSTAQDLIKHLKSNTDALSKTAQDFRENERKKRKLGKRHLALPIENKSPRIAKRKPDREDGVSEIDQPLANEDGAISGADTDLTGNSQTTINKSDFSNNEGKLNQQILELMYAMSTSQLTDYLKLLRDTKDQWQKEYDETYIYGIDPNDPNDDPQVMIDGEMLTAWNDYFTSFGEQPQTAFTLTYPRLNEYFQNLCNTYMNDYNRSFYIVNGKLQLNSGETEESEEVSYFNSYGLYISKTGKVYEEGTDGEIKEVTDQARLDELENEGCFEESNKYFDERHKCMELLSLISTKLEPMYSLESQITNLNVYIYKGNQILIKAPYMDMMQTDEYVNNYKDKDPKDIVKWLKDEALKKEDYSAGLFFATIEGKLNQDESSENISYLTLDEQRVWLYAVAQEYKTDGVGGIDEVITDFLTAYQDDINQRMGKNEAFETVKNIPKNQENVWGCLLNGGTLIFTGFSDGIVTFCEGIGNALGGADGTISANQYAQMYKSQLLTGGYDPKIMIDEGWYGGLSFEEAKGLVNDLNEISGVGKFIYGSIYEGSVSVGNQAIPLLARLVPGIGIYVGGPLLGISSYGNNLNTNFTNGHKGPDAYLNALASAAIEVVPDMIGPGFNRLGEAVAEPFFKSMIGEVGEELLQNILKYRLDDLSGYENIADVDFFDDSKRTLGATIVSSILLGGYGVISNKINNKKVNINVGTDVKVDPNINKSILNSTINEALSTLDGDYKSSKISINEYTDCKNRLQNFKNSNYIDLLINNPRFNTVMGIMDFKNIYKTKGVQGLIENIEILNEGCIKALKSNVQNSELSLEINNPVDATVGDESIPSGNSAINLDLNVPDSNNVIDSSNIPEVMVGSHFDSATFNEGDIVMVHSTNYFPIDGIIRTTRNAGARTEGIYYGNNGGIIYSVPLERNTIHFALNGLVSSGFPGASDWESRPYFILEPYKKHCMQQHNLNPVDTYFNGNIKLSDEAVIMIDSDYYNANKAAIDKMLTGTTLKPILCIGEKNTCVAKVVADMGYLPQTIGTNAWIVDGKEEKENVTNTNTNILTRYMEKYANENNIAIKNGPHYMSPEYLFEMGIGEKQAFLSNLRNKMLDFSKTLPISMSEFISMYTYYKFFRRFREYNMRENTNVKYEKRKSFQTIFENYLYNTIFLERLRENSLSDMSDFMFKYGIRYDSRTNQFYSLSDQEHFDSYVNGKIASSSEVEHANAVFEQFSDDNLKLAVEVVEHREQYKNSLKHKAEMDTIRNSVSELMNTPLSNIDNNLINNIEEALNLPSNSRIGPMRSPISQYHYGFRLPAGIDSEQVYAFLNLNFPPSGKIKYIYDSKRNTLIFDGQTVSLNDCQNIGNLVSHRFGN